MSPAFWGICLYVALQFGIAAWVSRRIRNEADYILAGRQLGVALGAFSIFATWFGTETILGSAGNVYANGLSGAQGEPFAYGFAIVLMGLFLAGRLSRRGLTTFADLFRQRYSRGVERLTVLLLVPGSILWCAAQIRGFGQVLGAASGLDIEYGIVIGFLIVVFYTMLGGLLADVYTDVVQGLAIVIGLFAIFIAVLLHVPGGYAGFDLIAPERLAFFGEEQTVLSFFEEWAVPICGSLVAIELISRILACKSPATAQRASVFGGMAYVFVALVPVYLGLVGPQIIGELSEAEQLIPELAERFLPAVFYVLLAGALISAIISTVDSALLAAASMISHNLIVPLRGEVSEAGKLWFARAGVAGLGTIAFVLAFQSTGISDLVVLASAFATAGVFVVTMFGLFSRFGGPMSAYAALVSGGAVWFLGAFVLGWSAPYLCGLVSAAVLYSVVGLFEVRTRDRHARA